MIKFMALVMSFFYLLTPLQNYLGETLHELWHFFETPNYVITHDNGQNEKHQIHEVDFKDTSHNHDVFEAVEVALKKAIQNSPSEKKEEKSTKIKLVKKHFINEYYLTFNNLPKGYILLSFSNSKGETCIGYFKKEIKPPQYIS